MNVILPLAKITEHVLLMQQVGVVIHVTVPMVTRYNNIIFFNHNYQLSLLLLFRAHIVNQTLMSVSTPTVVMALVIIQMVVINVTVILVIMEVIVLLILMIV